MKMQSDYDASSRVNAEFRHFSFRTFHFSFLIFFPNVSLHYSLL